MFVSLLHIACLVLFGCSLGGAGFSSRHLPCGRVSPHARDTRPRRSDCKNSVFRLQKQHHHPELQQTGEHKRMHELSKTPDSAKKCRILDGHPSGESLY